LAGKGELRGGHRVVLTQEQIQKRVLQLAQLVSADFRGQTIHAVCVLENGFVFMADLLRALNAEVKPNCAAAEAAPFQSGVAAQLF
jgi:hypoxanthine phosphoribosyltransferase